MRPIDNNQLLKLYEALSSKADPKPQPSQPDTKTIQIVHVKKAKPPKVATEKSQPALPIPQVNILQSGTNDAAETQKPVIQSIVQIPGQSYSTYSY